MKRKTINEADSEFVFECICNSKQVCLVKVKLRHFCACVTRNKIHRLLLVKQCESRVCQCSLFCSFLE